MSDTKIIEILKEIRPEFDYSEKFDGSLNGMLDSFDTITMVDMLEKEYSINIDALDIVPCNFSSVDSIINLLRKYEVTI